MRLRKQLLKKREFVKKKRKPRLNKKENDLKMRLKLKHLQNLL